MKHQPKRELFDKLIFLIQQRLGGKEAYANKVRELNPRWKNLDPDWITNFNMLNTVSLRLLIEALESSKPPNPDHDADKIPQGIRVDESKLNIAALKTVKFSEPDPRSLRY